MKRNLTAKEIKLTARERKMLPFQRKLKRNCDQISKKPYVAHFIREEKSSDGYPVRVMVRMWAKSNKDAERKAHRLENNRYKYSRAGFYRNLKFIKVEYDLYRTTMWQKVYYRAPICRFLDCDCTDCRGQGCNPLEKLENWKIK